MESDTLHARAEKVYNRNDLVKYIDDIVANFRDHPDEWENDSIESFLGGLSGFIHDADGYYRNNNIGDVDADVASWRLFADALRAAAVYE